MNSTPTDIVRRMQVLSITLMDAVQDSSDRDSVTELIVRLENLHDDLAASLNITPDELFDVGHAMQQ